MVVPVVNILMAEVILARNSSCLVFRRLILIAVLDLLE